MNGDLKQKEKIYLYYVVTDKLAHVDHIRALYQDEQGSIIQARIFTVVHTSIRAIKFLENGHLLILDNDMNLMRTTRGSGSKLNHKLVSSQSLKGIDRLKETVQKLKNTETIDLHERVLVIGKFIFSID